MVGLKKLADRLKLSVRTHVPKRLFMPVSRTDLLELVTAQDRIAMCSKDIAGLMLGRKMSFPKKMDTEVKEYLAACIEVSDQAMKAIDTLDEVFEAGFGRREVAKVDSMIKQIGKSEKKTDKLQIKVRALLFSMEESLPPVEVMFLYMILGLIGDIADYAERTGNRLQILISL